MSTAASSAPGILSWASISARRRFRSGNVVLKIPDCQRPANISHGRRSRSRRHRQPRRGSAGAPHASRDRATGAFSRPSHNSSTGERNAPRRCGSFATTHGSSVRRAGLKRISSAISIASAALRTAARRARPFFMRSAIRSRSVSVSVAGATRAIVSMSSRRWSSSSVGLADGGRIDTRCWAKSASCTSRLRRDPTTCHPLQGSAPTTG